MEISDVNLHMHGLTGDQVKTIQKHLNLVFAHEIDPEMGDEEHQQKLNSIHKPKIGGTSPDGQTYRC